MMLVTWLASLELKLGSGIDMLDESSPWSRMAFAAVIFTLACIPARILFDFTCVVWCDLVAAAIVVDGWMPPRRSGGKSSFNPATDFTP